jgi:hypothetical protein
MTNTFYENSQYSDTPHGLKLRQTIYETKATYGIINAVASGNYITYTCVNFYKPGQTVTITGIASNNNPSATANTGFNINNAIILSVTNTSFTVASTLAITETYTSGGNVTSGSVVIPSNIKRVYAVCIGGGGGGGAGRLSTSTTITNAIGNGVNAIYTANNSFVVGDTVNVSGVSQVSGVSLNNSYATVASATSTQFSFNNAITGTGSGGTAYNAGGAGGGGAGGISAGWTFASSEATIGIGGTSVCSINSYTPSNSGKYTIYGQVMAGGGGGGNSANVAPSIAPGIGGAGGGGTSSLSGGNGGGSYTGAPGTSNNVFGYGAGGAAGNTNGIDGVSGSGGGSSIPAVGTVGIPSGGKGLIGGGAASACTVGLVNSGTGLGGNSDSFVGGSGSTGTGILFGGGGGGAGYLANGENGVGNAGGNGGLGGGGGGASSNGAFSGKGGDGVIFLYY